MHLVLSGAVGFHVALLLLQALVVDDQLLAARLLVRHLVVSADYFSNPLAHPLVLPHGMLLGLDEVRVDGLCTLVGALLLGLLGTLLRQMLRDSCLHAESDCLEPGAPLLSSRVHHGLNLAHLPDIVMELLLESFDLFDVQKHVHEYFFSLSFSGFCIEHVIQCACATNNLTVSMVKVVTVTCFMPALEMHLQT